MVIMIDLIIYFKEIFRILKQEMNKNQNDDNSVATFVLKAFQIISNDENSSVIQWSPNGKQFLIKDIQQFQSIILPKYFRHRNVNSFVRQLNMYGFHKSRKQPSKNIFSHPYFQKDKRQLLPQVRRKIKFEQVQLSGQRKSLNIEIYKASQSKISNENANKQLQKENEERDSEKNHQKDHPINSVSSINMKSHGNFQKEQISGFINLMGSRSMILDNCPQMCLKLRGNNSEAEEDEEQDKISIADQINRQRERFNNRTQGISIVKTSNFLQDFDL